MILILSTHAETSTDRVIDWLIHYNANFLRLNDNDHFSTAYSNIYLSNSHSTSWKLKDLNGNDIDLESINTVWFRKWGFFNTTLSSRKIKEKFADYEGLSGGLMAEYSSYLKLILNKLKGKNWLTNPSILEFTKLEILIKAKSQGLNIPETLITNSREEASKFMESYDGIITKSQRDSFEVRDQDGVFDMFTHIVDQQNLQKLPEFFFPSMIQQMIEKEIEVRVFYILGKCYSMAIYSQQDEKTKVDFRVYNYKLPNRYVPYALPKDIEIKIDSLMTDLQLNCGSLDFIKSRDGKFFFLEINPVGQYGFVSNSCNYNLDKVIAQALIKLDSN